MNANLSRLLQAGNEEKLIQYVDDLDCERWSFVSFVDALIPYLIMESNLKFGNFHGVKMSLFLRKLSKKGIFSCDTEKAVAKVVLRELFNRDWVRIDAEMVAHSPESYANPVEEMLTEIQNGNPHNAYFYAVRANKQDKYVLFDNLLLNGTKSIPDTIGHSISCFYPVLEDVIDVDHPAAGTSLLSYIMYLCRFRQEGSLSDAENNESLEGDAKSKLLRQCASGDGIVNIHHMITYYILHIWEKANWSNVQPPWEKLTEWVGNKPIEERRSEVVKNREPVDTPPTYEEWQKIFASEDLSTIVNTGLSIVGESWERACNWFFRAYADYYTPDWDPHYYTSLYAGLELYRDETINKEDSQFALVQALEYFLVDIK